MDTRKLEILKNDTYTMLSLSEPGQGGEVIARIDTGTVHAEPLREVKRRYNAYRDVLAKLQALVSEIEEYGFIGVQGVSEEHENHWSGSPSMQEARTLIEALKAAK